MYLKLRKYCNFGPNILVVRGTSFQCKRLNVKHYCSALFNGFSSIR